MHWHKAREWIRFESLGISTSLPRQYNGGKNSLQKMVLEQLDINMKKKEVVPYFTQCIKTKQIKILNVKAKIIKFLDKHINFYHLRLCDGFLDMTPKAQSTKEK